MTVENCLKLLKLFKETGNTKGYLNMLSHIKSAKKFKKPEVEPKVTALLKELEPEKVAPLEEVPDEPVAEYSKVVRENGKKSKR